MTNRPTVLVNAVTMGVGGGIQVGVSFVEHAAQIADAPLQFIFAVSRPIYEELKAPFRSDSRIHVFDSTPARPVSGRAARRRLKLLESVHKPAIIYSIGFPSYVRFDAPEVGRYTNPWEFMATSVAWSTVPLRERLTLWLRNQYRLHWAQRAQYFETQTETASRGIVRTLGVPPERVRVFPNVANRRFFDAASDAGPPRGEGRRVLCLAADFRHKNLGLIPAVAKKLRQAEPQQPWHFVLTLPHDSPIYREIAARAHRFDVADMVENLGPIGLDECVREYRRATIVFLPTVLEVFSATYVEAMAMSRPIVTSDLDFAREVCGDAAVYFDPRSPEAAAKALRTVGSDAAARANLVQRGRKRLDTFPAPEEKHREVIVWLRDLIRGSSPPTFHNT